MLKLIGKLNYFKLVEKPGKKSYYNCQISGETESGYILTTFVKVYADSFKYAQGDVVELEVKVNAWSKDKFNLVSFG